jgi:hypothetical protein
MKLPCTASQEDVEEFEKGGTPADFKANDNLDYFNFFLKPGEHQPGDLVTNPEAGGCDWSVDEDGVKVPKSWPMTIADCKLGLDQVIKANSGKLADAIRNFHTGAYEAKIILLCALNHLGGHGGEEWGACEHVPTDCKVHQSSFGSYYHDAVFTPRR